eukprot:scaffold152637_cov12-Tisochrysis_lutea.AAC.1
MACIASNSTTSTNVGMVFSGLSAIDRFHWAGIQKQLSGPGFNSPVYREKSLPVHCFVDIMTGKFPWLMRALRH